MNLKRLSILCWALLLFFTQALPQTTHHKKERTVSIYGRVVDSFTHLCVLDAKITIMTSDSVMVDTCRTVTWNEEAIHPDAYFYLREKLSEDTYIFKIEHPDYQTTYINHELLFKGRQSSIALDDMPIQRKRMEDKEHTLDEVVVKSTKIKMVMKGDTLVFNAEAFNLPQGSMLDALIRQLPGATLNSHGEIFINGRKLDYLTLNGKDFFKKDNKTLIENLPSYTVKDLQVFEKLHCQHRHSRRYQQPIRHKALQFVFQPTATDVCLRQPQQRERRPQARRERRLGPNQDALRTGNTEDSGAEPRNQQR